MDGITEPNKRLLFVHAFSPRAQEILVDELEYDCADMRIIQALRTIESIFRAEGKLIMSERSQDSLSMHLLFGTRMQNERPFILDACEGEEDDTEISCSIADIQDIINYAIRQGMQEYLDEMKGAAEGN